MCVCMYERVREREREREREGEGEREGGRREDTHWLCRASSLHLGLARNNAWYDD